MINLENFQNLEIICLKSLQSTHFHKTLPASLKVLVIDQMKLNFMPFEANKSASSQLKELTFSGITWIASGIEQRRRRRVNKIMIDKEIVIEQLNKTFNEQEAIKLFNYFDSTNKGFLNLEDINKLNAFIFKKMTRLGDNNDCPDLGGIPATIFELTGLTLLNLSFQAIKYIPDQIESLVNLEKQILNNCILLESLSVKLSGLSKLRELSLSECISLKTTPAEIVRRGFPSIVSYLQWLSFGQCVCRRSSFAHAFAERDHFMGLTFLALTRIGI